MHMQQINDPMYKHTRQTHTSTSSIIILTTETTSFVHDDLIILAFLVKWVCNNTPSLIAQYLRITSHQTWVYNNFDRPWVQQTLLASRHDAASTNYCHGHNWNLSFHCNTECAFLQRQERDIVWNQKEASTLFIASPFSLFILSWKHPKILSAFEE